MALGRCNLDLFVITMFIWQWTKDLIFIVGALWFQDWEYCAPVGQTRYGAACVGDCAQRGKNYWWCLYFILNVDHLARARWCYTDKEEKEWEYCSPPGEVSSFQTYIPPLDRFLIHLGLMSSSGFGHSLYCQRPGLCWGMWNSRGEILVGMMSIVLLDECRCQLSPNICIFSTASALVIETD